MFGAMFGAASGMFGGGHKAPSGLAQALMQRTGGTPPPQAAAGHVTPIAGPGWDYDASGNRLPDQAQGQPQGMPFQPGGMIGSMVNKFNQQPRPDLTSMFSPSSPPPTPQNRVPPAAARWANAQQIQQAYANNWNPNPVLLRAALGK